MFNVYIAMLIWPLRMLGMIVAQSQRAGGVGRAGRRGAVPSPRSTTRPARRPARGGGECASLACASATAGPSRCSTASTCGWRRASRWRWWGRRARQDHRGPAHPAVLRRRGGDGEPRRRRRPHLALRDLRRAVGIVFEDTFLFSDTIAANIAFADPDAPTPSSGPPPGRRPRVHLRPARRLRRHRRARLLAVRRAAPAHRHRPGHPGRPPVLILDDATSAVDPTKEHEIRDALTEVMRGGRPSSSPTAPPPSPWPTGSC